MSIKSVAKAEEMSLLGQWINDQGNSEKSQIGVVSWSQGWGRLQMSRSIVEDPLCITGKQYEWGLGTHADSEIVLRCSKPLKTFRAWAGVDKNRGSLMGNAHMRFSIWSGNCCLAESQSLSVKSEPEYLTADLDGITEFTLKVKAEDTISFAHADWALAEAITSTGEVIRLGTPDMSVCNNILPVSFVYNGMESEEWFSRWGIKHTKTTQKDFILHRYVTVDTDTGLEFVMEMQEYNDLPACLWNVFFKNNGKETTPILEQVKTLDLKLAAAQQKMLYRARGSFNYEGKFCGEAFRDNFIFVPENMALKNKITMAGVGGRPSVDWMPYFNFESDGEGVMFGIGWTGQWQAAISSNEDGMHFQAGMEFIHTRLEPGETISQPAILMIRWQDKDPIRGHNLLRRFIFEKLSPRDSKGNVIEAPCCNLTWGGMVESSHLARIKNIADQNIPLDYYWIDAGWYGKAGPNADEFAPQWGSQAGDWSVNRDTFPNEFKEISAAAHAAGKKFLLWFEPERAICGTPITMEHPEYFLGQRNKGENMLLNLGLPEARQWCTELIAGMIESQGIDCYRQDFNFSPLPFWQGNDTPERVGISEIRYVEGLYEFLGELRRRFPDLLIDNCASGGRRLDFEMMRYSIPLWASDMQCFPEYIAERNMQQVHGLSYWLPQFAFGTQGHENDTYHFRSTIAAGVNIHLATYERIPLDPAYPYQWLRDRLNEYHRAKVFFHGDFYPLFDQFDNFKYWAAYQFHRPDLDGGILLFFRKKESNIEKISVPLSGLEAAEYEFENADNGVKFTGTFEELTGNGFQVEIAERRDCRMFFYQAKR